MQDWRANQELIDRLRDLHRGLHAAMTALITNGDRAEAELIMKQMDDHLRITIVNTKVPLNR